MDKRRNLALILLLVLLVGKPQGVSAQEDGPIYIVQAGDTLSSIARKFGTTLDELIGMNGISDPSRIYPGSELIIPGFSGVQGTLALQTVEFGETLADISRSSGTSQEALIKLNRVLRPDRIFAGMALIVPVQETGNIAPETGSQLLLARSGDTPIELAAKNHTTPWSISREQEASHPLWLLPGSVYAFLDSQSNGLDSTYPLELKRLRVAPVPLVQGHTLEFEVSLGPGLHPTGFFGPYLLNFFMDASGHWVCLQGIHALAEPGLFDFQLDLVDDQSGESIYRVQQPLQFISGDYGFQFLNGVPPETIDPAVTGPEEELIGGLMQVASPEKLWTGSFEYPSRYYTAEFISFFGTRRSYNNGALQYYHTGLDFYGQGVPIYAPAAGRVVFAGPLTVRGNATYLDHGWGVFSGYLHQSEIYVSVGDLVEKGQVIGQVGGTGRVTGPHLHWEIWVGGVPVEPLDWVNSEYPFLVEPGDQPQ